MTTIAPWLKAHLETTGMWNADGIGRNAHCSIHDCGAIVVAGLDHPRCGGPAVCDPAPLSPLGEALAVIGGRSTYTLRRMGKRLELDHRSALHIAGTPAGTDRADTVASHVCGAAQLPTMASAYQPTTKELFDAPPY